MPLPPHGAKTEVFWKVTQRSRRRKGRRDINVQKPLRSLRLCVLCEYSRARLQSETLPDLARRAGAVHRVEVQTGRAAGEQLRAQVGGHVQAEGAQRFEVVAEALEALADPARDFGAAAVREARQLLVVGDRHDAG